ncbi:hypothetical protein [Peteryoungia algae]|uniref:Uncharacterized protein n=1 Tax=Peteryoungia algae TaxID=2919917 RepID=A0ABT0D5G7_9HYPH|nr:hypothetical protein [Rhizobium sp. SSM4.3]MCJ8240665.1 hypothetical protein [Rhizobium sp. SSM4.3]
MPITTLRGLALLGLREGQEMSLINSNGVEEKILLEKVEYQPEAARREREALGREERTPAPRPILYVVSGGLDRRHGLGSNPTNGFYDPGPPAA